jgi:hypothetical protein
VSEEDRDAVRAEAASQLVQLAGAIAIGFAFAFSQRLGSQPDMLDTLRRRLRHLTGVTRRREAVEDEVRRFRRDMSVWEHTEMGR